jgi:two-component system response regulator MprA
MAPKRSCLLIVDDDTAIAALLAQLLASDDYEVETAPDGRAALDLIARRRFDLIVSDVWMPRLDGAGLYHELARSRPDLAHRMVFVTGGPLTPDLQRLVERANAPLLQKPFELERLRRELRRVLERGAA